MAILIRFEDERDLPISVPNGRTLSIANLDENKNRVVQVCSATLVPLSSKARAPPLRGKWNRLQDR